MRVTGKIFIFAVFFIPCLFGLYALLAENGAPIEAYVIGGPIVFLLCLRVADRYDRNHKPTSGITRNYRNPYDGNYRGR